MISTLKKKLSKKGFTLAELLVVVAIIAVLVAISIPIFNSQLEKSRDAVTVSNIRAAYAEATAELLSATKKSDGTYNTPVNTNITIAAGTTTGTTNVTVNNVVVKGANAASGSALSGLEVELPFATALTNAQCQDLNAVTGKAGASGKVKITFTYTDGSDALPTVSAIAAATT